MVTLPLPSDPRSAVRRSRLRHLPLPVALVGLVLAGCAGDGQAAVPADLPDGAVSVVGTDRLTFEPDTLEVPAGEVTFALTCEGGVNHNLVIDDEVVAECRRGETDLGTVELDAGTYEYVCTIPGHERTMRGTLTVS
jgi:plastocyanin